jgi:DNA-binding LacI/PurR family transcriptional regulator
MPEEAGKSNGRVTLRDVAECVGLSVSAASLALAGHPRIPETTQARVREAAAALGYTPNGAARALRTQRQRAIALLTFGPGAHESLSFYSEAVVAVAEEALRHDHNLVLVNARPGGGSEQPLQQVLAGARVDGAVCLGTQVTPADMRAMQRANFPFIFIGKREVNGLHIPYVATDYLQAARMATAHLLTLGHRRIGVAVTAQERNLPWIRDRLAGHALALFELGLPADAGPVLEVPPASAEDWDGYQWQEEGITAIFATTFAVAQRLLRHLQICGVRVPDEVAVVGFDEQAGTALTVPPLTTVRQPLAALGALAARTLLAWLDGAPRQPEVATLPALLVVRRSCGARTTDTIGQEPGVEGLVVDSLLAPALAPNRSTVEEEPTSRRN